MSGRQVPCLVGLTESIWPFINQVWETLDESMPEEGKVGAFQFRVLKGDFALFPWLWGPTVISPTHRHVHIHSAFDCRNQLSPVLHINIYTFTTCFWLYGPLVNGYTHLHLNVLLSLRSNCHQTSLYSLLFFISFHDCHVSLALSIWCNVLDIPLCRRIQSQLRVYSIGYIHRFLKNHCRCRPNGVFSDRTCI